MYKLGVVIPTIKEGPFLIETIASVASAVRGLSIDVFVFQNGHSILDKSKYESLLPKINWVESPRIDHVANSWNRCVEVVCDYDLIHILHDDDYIHPNFYMRIFQMAVQYSKAGLLVTGVLHVDGLSNPVRYKNFNCRYAKLSQSTDIAAAETNIFECVGVVIFRKNVRDLKIFSDQFKLLTDWDAWVRITLRYGAVQIPEILAFYRRHDENYSRALRASGRDALERIRFFKKYKDIRERGLNDKRRIVLSIIAVLRSLKWQALTSQELRDMIRFVGLIGVLAILFEMLAEAINRKLFA